MSLRRRIVFWDNERTSSDRIWSCLLHRLVAYLNISLLTFEQLNSDCKAAEPFQTNRWSSMWSISQFRNTVGQISFQPTLKENRPNPNSQEYLYLHSGHSFSEILKILLFSTRFGVSVRGFSSVRSKVHVAVSGTQGWKMNDGDHIDEIHPEEHNGRRNCDCYCYCYFTNNG